MAYQQIRYTQSELKQKWTIKHAITIAGELVAPRQLSTRSVLNLDFNTKVNLDELNKLVYIMTQDTYLGFH